MSATTLNVSNITAVATKTSKIGVADEAFTYMEIADEPINVRAVVAEVLSIPVAEVTDEMVETGYNLGLDNKGSYEITADDTVGFAWTFAVSDGFSDYL